MVWDKQAENLTKFQGKGSLIGIDGTLRTDTYEVEGKKRQKNYVMVNVIDFLEKKEGGTQQVLDNEFSQVKEKVEFDTGEQIQITDEDLPW